MIGTIQTLLWSMRQKVKWMDLTFLFSDDTDHNLNDLRANVALVSFRSVRSSRRPRHALQITTTWTTSICAGTPSIWWDGIYCLWDWWKISRVFFPLSIRKGNVALMLWYGEKSDLAPGSGMFLVRLWWVGPGRGHMKGSFCQAAKDVQSKSNEYQNTWTDLRTCHTLHKHYSYNTVDKLSIPLLLPKADKVRSLMSMCVPWLKSCTSLPGHWSENTSSSKDRQIMCLLLRIAFASVSPLGTLFPRLCAWKSFLGSYKSATELVQ